MLGDTLKAIQSMELNVKILAIAIGITASLSQAVAAQDCPTIDNDLDRLACYDQKSGRTATSIELASSDNWNVRVKKSEFKDTTDVFLWALSVDEVQCRSYGPPEAIRLYLRCRENTTSIYINTNCHLTSGHGGYGVVEYRIDDTPAGKQGFDNSTDNKALGLWSGGSSIPFIKRLLGHDKLLIRFTPYGQSASTAKFDISGLEDVIKPLREACHW